MARVRTVDFLPEIFKTDVNQEFLAATLDQLIQKPKLKQVEGYIGRRFGPGVNYTDSYVLEPTNLRTHYQLEAGVVSQDDIGKAVDAITYPGLIDAIALAGGNVTRHDRLFKSETYSWDPLINFDKFINYGQYYWVPEGPMTVDVFSTTIALVDDFDVSVTNNVYNISGTSGSNPTITLVRGGNYTFSVDSGNFWIQTQPGVDGKLDFADNRSSRDVLGVLNNGSNSVTFNVPMADAQDFYHNLTDIGQVDLVTNDRFDSINNRLVSEVGSIDGIIDLDGRTIAFINPAPGNSEDLGWQRLSMFDNSEYDDTLFSETEYLDTNDERYAIFRIRYITPPGGTSAETYISLEKLSDVNQFEKFNVGYGNEFNGLNFFKNAEGKFEQIPLLTSAISVLYYQDGSTSNRFGIIKLVDQEGAETLDIADIIGKETYTSPNGVVFTNGLKVKFTGNVVPTTYENKTYYVEGVGEAIQLVLDENLITPGPWFDNVINTDNQPQELEYLTVNRGSNDLNPWSRGNRWFHKDVINAAAEYNNTVAVIDNEFRAKRPIIEFDAGLKLYNFGTNGIAPIDVIDFTQTDALSNVHGTAGLIVDGYTLTTGSRVIFANDEDSNVRNKIYRVQMVDPDDDSTEYGTIINLIPADDAIVVENDVVTCVNGTTLIGTQYTFDGTTWTPSQSKTTTNQAPLFDVFDENGYSLSNEIAYNNTTFSGTELFSYKIGTSATVDSILGFSLTYLNIDNIGDIVFENDFYNDTFNYDNVIGANVNLGFLRKYADRTSYTSHVGWKTSAETNWQRQVFTYTYNGSDLVLNVVPKTDLNVPAIKVYVNNKFVRPAAYTYRTTASNTYITFNNGSISLNDVVQVKIISDQASSSAYYETPSNLDKNPFNESLDTLSLGTIRNHYTLLTENLNNFSGVSNGANNTRDIGYLSSYGDVIVQHSAPTPLAAHLYRNENFNFFDSVEYCARQYEKFKYRLLDWVANTETYNKTPAELLDEAMLDLNQGKTLSDSFYLSNMCPTGNDYTEITHSVTLVSTNDFETNNVYDFTKATTAGLLIYLNDTLLTKDYDYTVATDGPRVTFLTTLTDGDIITIKEFQSTYGNYVPETPTKLGLFPKFRPEIITDDTYTETQTMIQGHDGSLTVGFDDIRDEVLLEFETRIFNNISIDPAASLPMEQNDIIPGQFRNTDYTDTEISEIISAEFLNWVGWHRLDYKSQNYSKDNKWTWNYSSATSKIDNNVLKGHWRGIYRYLFDTDRPHTHPWEMLSFSEKPDWWEDRYGPAPYTSGNLILWEDLELGKVADPDNEYYKTNCAREGLTSIIPTDSEGNLLDPMTVIVKSYVETAFERSWNSGDGAPVETAWRRSSAWPFALQKIYALTHPAKYFALAVDVDRYTYNPTIAQYAYDSKYKLNPKNVDVVDTDNPKHSYLNWIIDYNLNYGVQSSADIADSLSKLDVRLCYRMAGFTDKKYLKIFTDKSAPDSTNTSLLIPDESYQVLLYKNQSFGDLQYSSIMVQRTDNGYAVFGNSITHPYFRILKSTNNGNYENITVGSQRIRIPNDFTNQVVRVPYGYTFKTINGVVDFVVSYGAFLKRQGMKFDDIENNYILDWPRMAQEFVYWANQDWIVGSAINLNPSANVIECENNYSIIDSLDNLSFDERPLDQNRQTLNKKDYTVVRLGNNFKIKMLADKSLSYLRVRKTSYEHLLILDNTSIFNDLLYQPVTGLRQQRVKLNGFVTFDWNGQLDAQGFILNQDNVPDWDVNLSYNKGDMVQYKNSYWVAASKISPTGEDFNFDEWTKIDYNLINKGLLPNISNKAGQIRNFYNHDVINLESDADLLGLGITGFRKRSYLESLNLSDISQVHIYENLIGQKGTPDSVNLFKGVEFDKEVSEYEINENWAIKRAAYGATDNKRYIELELDSRSLTSNPSIIEINVSGTDSDANQLIDIDNIYRQSVKNTTINILPERTETVTDVGMPTSGFVDINDVDIILFSLSDIESINDQLDLVKQGSIIWVAKSNRYDWNIYRCQSLQPKIVSFTDNLNGTLTVEFSGTHSLLAGEYIIVKFFDEALNGIYKVNYVDNSKLVVVSGSIVGQDTVVEGSGVAFVLQTAKVTQPKDIANTIYNNNLFAGDKIWVTETVNGNWQVFEKTNPNLPVEHIITPNVAANTNFGYSLAQSLNENGAIVGAPNDTSGIGALHCYNRINDDFVFTNKLTLGATGTQGYGNDVSLASTWGVAGASLSDSEQGYAVVVHKNQDTDQFEEWQLLNLSASVTGSDEFGHAVTISDDENWIYVSALDSSMVYAFNKVTYQTQTVSVNAVGGQATYDFSDYIEADTDIQVIVEVNGIVLDPIDYVFAAGTLTFLTIPLEGQSIVVTRRTNTTLTGDGSTLGFSIANLYTAQSIDAFSVFDPSGNLLRPYTDYTYSAGSINFTVAPGNGDMYSVRAKDYYRYVGVVEASPPASEAFGSTIATTSDGQQILIGAPEATVSGQVNAGKVYVYERKVERFVITDATEKEYTTTAAISNLNNVKLNNVLLINGLYNVDDQYTIDSGTKTVTIDNNVTLTVGSTIDVDTNVFAEVQTLTSDRYSANSYYGSSLSICRTDCSMYVGAPNDSYILPDAGSVTRYLNSSRVFGTITGNTSNPSVTIGHSIRINNIEIIFTGTTLSTVVEDINNAIVPNVSATVSSSNELVINIINRDEAPSLSMMTVMPGLGTGFTDLGLEPFVQTQYIVSPRPEEYSYFGHSVHVDYSATNLIIGAPRATAILLSTFDYEKDSTEGYETIFDSGTTRIVDPVTDSGAVYTYDLLPSSTYGESGSFVFGQQIYDPVLGETDVDGNKLRTSDQFGYRVHYTDGALLVTSPGYDSESVTDIGRLSVFNNNENKTAWDVIKEQALTVDSNLINSVYIYNKESSQIETYLDYIDPLNGKLLGTVRDNLDYVGAIDPAIYNSLDNTGIIWGKDRVGHLWWDTTNARFLDYNQEDIVYSAKNWASLIPGSSIDVYEWVESQMPPSQYAGDVKNVDEYTLITSVNSSKTVISKYYFWALKTTNTNTAAGKTLSAELISQYIENPISSGIPFAALMHKNIIALYNVSDYIRDNLQSVLHINYNKIQSDNNVFVEYDLIKEENKNGFLTNNLYRKLLDSFCGVDTLGNLVPDQTLKESVRHGVSFRPRQTMFIDRQTALNIYLTKANRVIKQYPFSELRNFDLLSSEEEIPTEGSGAWDLAVADLTELSYQEPVVLGIGYKILVLSDSSQFGLWTIYEVQDDYTMSRIQTQEYDCNRYWSYVDWYADGYTASMKPNYKVNTYSEIQTLQNAVEGTLVKVISNSNGKWELYSLTNSNWTRVGLEQGTVQISTTDWNWELEKSITDAAPTYELRQILKSINEEILIGDFLLERNRLLISTFNYIQSEFDVEIDWLMKTSLIDVTHKVRDLDQYDIYRKDNQDFVIDYIKEAKPYHVKIKEFLLRYDGSEQMLGDLVDFDCPSTYSTAFSKFISPILDDDIAILETDQSNFEHTELVWQTQPWKSWFDNHKLSISEVVVTNGGSNYTVAPLVIVDGIADRAAEMTAVLNEYGEVGSITINDPGAGYRTTPIISFTGGNGTGAVAVAYTKQDVVRSFTTTIKYDRYEYDSQILIWEDINWDAAPALEENQLVRYNDLVYRAINADGSTVTDPDFNPDEYELVDPSTLSGIDRTLGFYTADINELGLDLALLIDGLTYPGVQLTGPSFGQSSGYDVGYFDINLWDNLEYGPEGLPTYSKSILDNEIFTSFTGSYPGVDLSGIESVQATAISTVSGGSLDSLIMVDIGKGYDPDVPPTVSISAPADNISATAAIASDGDIITGITVTKPGLGYVTTPTVTIIEADPTPGITATAEAIISSGSVTSAPMVHTGNGYDSVPTVTFSDPPSVVGARAQMTSSIASGQVNSCTIIAGGNSYLTPPTVTVSAPAASVNATASATSTAFEVHGLALNLVGNYYSSAPSVTISPPTETAQQAVLVPVMSAEQVTNFTVSNAGYLYDTSPTVTVVPAAPTPGINAAATCVLDPDSIGFDGVDASGNGFDAAVFDGEGGVGTFTITVSGSGYTVAPVVTLSAPDLSGGTQATAVATISGETAPLYAGQGSVLSISVVVSGSGYTTAPSVSIAAPDSSINHGTGASITATRLSDSTLEFHLNSSGNYYDITPTITIDPPTAARTATATTTVLNGLVQSIILTDAGWGYIDNPTVTIGAPDTSPVNAVITTTLTGGVVTGYTITNPGAGYITAPTLVVDAPAGVASDIATGTATVVDRKVTGIVITNSGASYSTPPTVTIEAPTGLSYHGSGATATATIVNNRVSAIAVTNPGSGYDIAPTITISEPTRTTSRALATANIVGGSITSLNIVDAGYGYLTAPTVTIGPPTDVEPDSDIVGGQFVDDYNSHAPEELVPGATFDTLDFKVFTKPGYDYSGSGFGFSVTSENFTYQTNRTTFSFAGLELHPSTIIVYNSTAGIRLYEGIQYTVDWANMTVSINSGVSDGEEVKIFVYSIGGGNQHYRNVYLGNQFDTVLTVPVEFTDVDSILVLINGSEVTNYTYIDNNNHGTDIIFDTTYTSSDFINVTVFGELVADDSTATDYGYSYPETEEFIADGSTTTFTLNVDTRFKNRENLIVEVNGRRLRPFACAKHAHDGSVRDFVLPFSEESGIDQSTLTDADVVVYEGEVRLIANEDYVLSPADGSSGRYISIIGDLPPVNTYVDVYVLAGADYSVSTDGTTLTITGITLSAGDHIAVTSWHDVREQDICTHVFEGPTYTTVASKELFDAYGFDSDLFDKTVGVESSINYFNLDRPLSNSDRLWVTVNGRRLLPGAEYSIVDNSRYLLIAGGSIADTDVVAVTSITNVVVPDTLSFRIFKDMRDNVAIYKNNHDTNTFLTQPLRWTDDVIYVDNASNLGEPDLNAAVFGIVEINGERITYRNRDVENNTLSGLRRGTAGTGIQRYHDSLSVVSDLSKGQLLNQNYSTIGWNFSSEFNEGDIVKVGLVHYVAIQNVPAEIEINNTAYWQIYDKIWYAPGATSASNGIPLQQQTTVEAKFLRGR